MTAIGSLCAALTALATVLTGSVTTGAVATSQSVGPLTPACASKPGPYLHCFALYRAHPGTRAALDTGPTGWGATDLAAAYHLPTDDVSSTTVAVSIAYDTPDLEQDLAVYRAQYGLPGCTTANGCFTKVNQSGAASPLPASSVGTGWDVEATLDVAMISAACPACHILVVEGNSDDYTDLAATETTAVGLGAQVVSNSYGSREWGLPVAQDSTAYNQPGHTIVVASGDNGYTAASFPADLGSVVAVGGTELAAATNARGYTESAWSSSGSGCSAYVAKPSWQHDPDCANRTVADVSAVADNVAVYIGDLGGWSTVAGTSVAAPFIAGVYGLAGNATSVTAQDLYQHAADLFDVTTGTNDTSTGTGAQCDDDYLCVAGPGYDAPTGLGTPNGITAF